MPDNNKTDEFLEKLKPCIDKGELDACVDEAVRLAEEMGISASELLERSSHAGMAGIYVLAYVLAGAAANGLEGKEKAGAHYDAGLAAKFLGKVEKAEKHYKLAIEADPKYATAHGNYGLLLIETDNRKEALDKIQKASVLFTESRDLTKSHLAKAWFYERYAEKYFNQRKFPESGEDAGKAGDEYLKAAETADDDLKENFSQQGNILKAKSFVRKVPKKTWRRKILYRLGKKRDIPEIINNLKQATSYYEKASMCPVDEKQDVCNACHISITVFSETLSAIDGFMNKRSAEIDKKEWIKKLDTARLIYEKKEMDKGVALVDTLKQLIQCVDELAVHRANRLKIQRDKCGKCFGRLVEVSEKLDGALNVLAEHSIEAIQDYAKKQGMGGFGEIKPQESKLKYWVYGVFATIIIGYLTNQLFEWKAHEFVIEFLKNIFNQTQP